MVAVNWQAVTRPKPPKRFDTLKWAYSPCASAPRAERPTSGLSAFDAWKYARAVNEGKGRGIGRGFALDSVRVLHNTALITRARKRHRAPNGARAGVTASITPAKIWGKGQQKWQKKAKPHKEKKGI